MNIKLGGKLQALRKGLGYSQKDFAEFLGIPQPSLSAYENEKNSPTIEVLFNIAKKCNISLDWLCGLTADNEKNIEINELCDLASVMYKLMEINEIDINISFNKPDIETENDRWSANLTIFGNDKNHKYNGDFCQIINTVNELNLDIDSFEIDAETYELKKERDIAYYNQGQPLTKRIVPKLTREERIRKRNEWLAKNPYV